MKSLEKELRQEFERIVTDQLDSLYRTAHRLLGHSEDAEDAVQECCARAFKSLAGLNSDDPVRSWLFRILKNVCIDRLRARSRVSFVSTDAAEFSSELHGPSAVNSPERQCISSGLGRMIDQALLRLSTEQRAVVVLVLIEDFSYAEAAAALQVPVGTVRSRLNRGRVQLREALSSSEGVKRPTGSPARLRLVV